MFYEYVSDNDVNSSHTCDPTKPDPCDNQQSSGVSGYLYVFMLAQFVHGIGFTPFFTLGSAYIDDNAKTDSTAVYLSNSPKSRTNVIENWLMHKLQL